MEDRQSIEWRGSNSGIVGSRGGGGFVRYGGDSGIDFVRLTVTVIFVDIGDRGGGIGDRLRIFLFFCGVVCRGVVSW